jgi:hypothetical protein
MKNLSIISHELYKVFLAFGGIYLAGFCVVLVFMFYRWIAKAFICPIFWIFGSREPRKLFWKIEHGFIKYIWMPLFVCVGTIIIVCGVVAYSVGAILGVVFIISAYASSFWHFPLFTGIASALFVYVKVIYPRYKKAFGPKKVIL